MTQYGVNKRLSVILVLSVIRVLSVNRAPSVVLVLGVVLVPSVSVGGRGWTSDRLEIFKIAQHSISSCRRGHASRELDSFAVTP